MTTTQGGIVLPRRTTSEQAADIRKRYEDREEYLKAQGWPVEYSFIAESRNWPTNDEVSSLEVYEFCQDIPDRYFLYVDHNNSRVTTWTGETLGTCLFGRVWRSNFGDLRQSIVVFAINGYKYTGTYFRGVGDYARIRRVKG